MDKSAIDSYQVALNHLNLALVLIDDIGDTLAAAEIALPIDTVERRISEAGKPNRSSPTIM